MGLDIVFHAQSKLDSRYRKEVGYFSKVNFLLTYFDVGDDHSCDIVAIPRNRLYELVSDLCRELERHSTYKTTEPDNPKLKTKKVFFGGSVEYDDSYWHELQYVYDWAKELSEDPSFDWERDNLEMFFSY